MKPTQCVRRSAGALAVFLFTAVPLHAATLLKEFQSIGVELVDAGGFTYFAAGTAEAGVELWRTDGTVDGTRLVADIALGPRSSHPSQLTAFAGGVYFTADDGVRGRELWKADGSGVAMVRDVAPGPFSSAPQKLTAVGSTLFFSAYEPASGRELWTSDGSEAGTRLVADVWPGPRGSSPGGLAASNGVLFFAAHTPQLGRELWKSTPDGTRLVADIRRGIGSSSPRELTALGGLLLFTAHDREHGSELWKSDGTSEGTRLIKDVAPGPHSSWPSGLVAVGGAVFFSAADRAHGRELWKSDGTADGTGLVRDIEPGATSSAPASLTAAEGRLFFTAEARASGRELWTSDGGALGTRLVKDIFPGAASAFRYSHMLTNGLESSLFSSPWAAPAETPSDDASAGTSLLELLEDHVFAQASLPMATRDGSVFFAPYEPRHGMEPWTSDGSEAHTRLLEDISEGRRSTLVPVLLATAEGLLIGAHGESGDRLWIRRPVPPSGPPVALQDVILEEAQGGLWKGTTGQNEVYELTVSNDTITKLRVKWRFSSCSTELTTSFTPPPTVSGDSFSFGVSGCPSFNTSGSFSGDTASGSFRLFPTSGCTCTGDLTTSWTATLSPATLTISDPFVFETNTGSTNAVFMVTLGRAQPQPVTVDYATAARRTSPRLRPEPTKTTCRRRAR